MLAALLLPIVLPPPVLSPAAVLFGRVVSTRAKKSPASVGRTAGGHETWISRYNREPAISFSVTGQKSSGPHHTDAIGAMALPGKFARVSNTPGTRLESALVRFRGGHWPRTAF